ncbi:CBS domain-containing protein [Paeniclostridium sp. NSJ-45]|uniref:CBS domain-containing protein n=1 Tax=Paeniclostridium hominis TaxID=2764329 RepID=A0ABR7K1I9_9FIRM|nr:MULTISPECIES: CBS domain-containing protein [Paeniclostridium]MBC6002749.1 CBS domain-containing protein [Paeniclostridium hominis]
MNILFFITPKVEVEYVYDYYTIRQAMEKMEYHRYTSIPIINKKGEYVATITEGDLLWKIKSRFEDKQDDINLKSLENIDIKNIDKYNDYKTVSINSDMENIISLAINQNFIPVVDDQNIFIGIIKRSDIISYFNDKMNDRQLLNIDNKVS